MGRIRPVIARTAFHTSHIRYKSQEPHINIAPVACSGFHGVLRFRYSIRIQILRRGTLICPMMQGSDILHTTMSVQAVANQTGIFNNTQNQISVRITNDNENGTGTTGFKRYRAWEV
ncbi:hypothetical protein DEU56DRAFT_756283 [Suillus clintonianus]|uniref:uncharacterized protein n=1 Tax=Suillus clintonianus TaxID=1904413 RepID=UPI001B86A3D6|nr:uncharacterized protein DEU56DRAFT_756283 [Suillus clintonianus]KAG2136716.1 hypothetical protein DEU56DRAFT_756283 [Suillus clintonianus]